MLIHLCTDHVCATFLFKKILVKFEINLFSILLYPLIVIVVLLFYNE